MKRQPGFVSTQLHRAVGENPTYLNYAVWDFVAAFRAAFTHPDFLAKLSTYPSSAVASRTCSKRSQYRASASGREQAHAQGNPPVAGLVALLTIATFWLSTALSELFGSTAAVTAVKTAIPWGFLLLIPALAAVGGSGFAMAQGARDG